MKNEEAIEKILKKIDRHLVNTCNAGIVLANAEPEDIKKLVNEALALSSEAKEKDKPVCGCGYCDD